MAYKPYMFSVPSLPGDTYEKLKAVGNKLQLGQWEVVVLAQELLHHICEHAPPDTIAQHVEKVKKLKPWTRKSQPK